MNKIIFIAGGGTGGHLFPAISIGNELVKNNFSIIFIGSKFGIEKKLFENHYFKYHLLNIMGLQRDFSIRSIFKNILFPIRFLLSYYASIRLILKYKPCAIIGTGGYASGLPLLAGIHLNIPVFIQDQNSVPGMITRKLQNYTQKIFSGYPITQGNNKKNNYLFTGNPIRNDLKKLEKYKSKINLKFEKNKKLILIIGGSQGAHPINEHIMNNIEFYINNNYQILWQCGSYDIQNIRKKINNKLIKILEFIDDMSLAYSAADIVISRAGAIAISELVYYEKAMVLIPLPSAAENHQKFNAEFLEKKNACKKIDQNQLSEGILENSIQILLNNKEKINSLENNVKNIFKSNANKVIVKKIIEYVS